MKQINNKKKDKKRRQRNAKKSRSKLDHENVKEKKIRKIKGEK